MNREVLKVLVPLKDRVVKNFTSSDWQNIGAITGSLDRIERHSRLLRSLSFGDDDYEGNALSVLTKIIEDDYSNFNLIQKYLDERYPDSEGENVSSEPKPERRIVFSPTVFSIPDEGVDRGLVSLMMPFDAGFSPVYASIQAAVADAGMRCDRADNIWEHSVIIQDIFTLIFRSFIVVCDFSGKNPNVFYEAGIAHTLGKHVVPITQSADDIPFDLKHHRYLRYLNNKEGRKALQVELAKRLKTLTGFVEGDWRTS